MSCYLFVHFREKRSPDGEQVYFGLSRDGFRWEAVNGGQPVLWAYCGDHGVRDMTITRGPAGGFDIFATDLSLAYGMRGKYHNSWEAVRTEGSRCLAHWHSEDLVNWSDEELLPLGDGRFTSLWAPDVLKDGDDYLLHWTSPDPDRPGHPQVIFASRSRDLRTWGEPFVLFRREEGDTIDSACYREGDRWYLFVKSAKNPSRVQLFRSACPTGPWERMEVFDRAMVAAGADGHYEAPTALRLPDGRWVLYLDWFGAKGSEQGYRPFLADRLADPCFVRADGDFTFPYRFKHGTVLEITEEEYARVRDHDWRFD